MTAMIRKQIYLRPDQVLLAEQLAVVAGVSKSAIVRQAIEKYIAHLSPSLTAWKSEREYILSRIAMGTVSGRRTWERESLYD